uniref:Alkylglycerol monooxygenase n=1 Tax=Setaria digitata TaxID=48799 RepID=A0A915PJZ6_9BILA
MSFTNYLEQWLSQIFPDLSLLERLLHRLDLNSLRHTYYLITPNETMFETIDEVPNYTTQVSLWWLVFIMLEFCFLMIRGNSGRFALNDSITSISAGILSQCFKQVWWKDDSNICLWLHLEQFSTSREFLELIIDLDLLSFFPGFHLFDNYGSLGIILNTPSHHRVHHGRNPYCIDRNYAGVFIIWDKMFGTFEPERPLEKPVYGLVHRERNFNQIYLQFHSIYDILFVKWRMKTEKGEPIFRGIEKLKAIYYPPIYLPGMKVRQYFHWFSMVDHEEGIPPIEDEVILYNPTIPTWQKAYCFGHFLLLLVVYFHFEFDRGEMSYIHFTVKLAFFIITMQCLGAFFDRKMYSPYQEILRCIAVTASYIFSITSPAEMQSSKIFMIVVYMLSAIFLCGYIACHIDSTASENAEKIMMKKVPTNRVSGYISLF